MPVALSKTPKSAKTSKPAQPSEAAPGGVVSASVQRMPAYSLGQGEAPSVSLLSGAVQAKASGDNPQERKDDASYRPAPRPADDNQRKQDEQARAGVVQREAEETEEHETTERPGQEPETGADVQAEFTSADSGGASASGGGASESSPSSSGPGAGAGSGGDVKSSSGNGSPIHAVASKGLSRATRPLPEMDRIQKSFGGYDVSGVRVQVGGPAERANEDLGARAYTSGNQIAFKQEPDLHLAAHEAAHVVQQRRGVHLKGGVGEAGDPYERQADGAADAVVAGESAEPVLDAKPGPSEEGGGVQMACECGGSGCAACAKGEQDEPVQMQLEVTTERERPPQVARAGGGSGGGGRAASGGAGAEAAPEEKEQAGQGEGEKSAQEQTGAEDADAVAEEAKGKAAGSVAKQTETQAAQEQAATKETTEERPAASEESQPAGRRGEQDAGRDEAAGRGVGEGSEAVTSGGQGASNERGSSDEEEAERRRRREEAASAPSGEMVIQRACDPPPPPSTREHSEDDAPPPDPPPGEVRENAQSDGPTAEEQPGAGENELVQSLDDASPAEAAEAVASEATEAEPAGEPGGEPAAVEAAAGQSEDEAEGGDAQGASQEMEGSIAQAEDARAGAVAAYEMTTATLETARGSAGQLAGADVNFPKIEGGTDADDRQRVEAGRVVKDFMAEGSRRITDVVTFAQEVIPERLGGSAEAAKANIEAAADENSAALSARIAQARGDAFGQAAAVRGQIEAAHGATLASIEAETMSALDALDSEYNAASEQIAPLEEAQIANLDTLYAEGDRMYHAVAPKITDAATEKGNYWAGEYDKCHINEKDSFWDGHLTDRRADARMEAAHNVAKGYAESLNKEVDKQAEEGAKGLPKDQETVHAIAAKTRETLDSQYQKAVELLLSTQTQSTTSADSTRTTLLASVDKALRSTLRSLDRQEQSQLQSIADTRYLQIVTVEHVAHAAASSLQENLFRAAGSLQQSLQSVPATLTKSPAPDPQALRKVLSQATATVDAGLGNLYGSIGSGLAGIEGRIAEQGGQSVQAIANIGASGMAQADQTSAGFSQSMASLEQSAADNFARLTEQHTSSVESMASATVAGFAQVITGLSQSYEALSAGITGRFTEAAAGLEAGLRDALTGMDSGKDSIPHYADEAASHVEPAWKSIVKWVLIALIVIAFAFIIGPAVIGAAGALLGSTAAGAIVGGALVGAVSSGLIQVVNNWASNRTWYEGVGKAMIIGAIGGALGAGAGLAIEKVGGVVAQFALRVGFDAVLDIGTQLVTTGHVDWEGFGISMVMSILMNGVSEIPSVKNFQHGIQTRAGAAFGGVHPSVHAGAVPHPGAEGVTPHPTGEGGAPHPGEGGAAPHVAPEAPATHPTEGGAGTPHPEGEVAAPHAEGETGGAPRPAEEGGKPRAESEPPRADAEVEATTTRQAEEGRQPNPEAGDTPRLESDPEMPANQRTDSELAEAATSAEVGDTDHGVVPREWPGEGVKLVGCSPGCGPLTEKINGMVESEAVTPKAREELAQLKSRIETLEGRIKNGEVSSGEIVKETAAIAKSLEEIGARHSEVGEALNAPPSAGSSDAEVRQENAGEWGVDPETGKFPENGKVEGLTEAEIKQRARRAEQPNEPDIVRRWRRYTQETPAGDRMPFNKWAESGFRANVNREASSPHEAGALEAAGATPNNAAGEGETYTSKEYVDPLGRPVPRGTKGGHLRTETTRPDGTRPNDHGGTDVVEHKHLTGDTEVYNDTQQLRGQRKMANKLGGDHELILSSDRPFGADGNPQVRPSTPLGESGSRIYYYDPATGRITHAWSNGAWTPI
jgi:hypothetical protein